MKQISEDDFYDTYKPIPTSPGGDHVWFDWHDPDDLEKLQQAKIAHTWTCVDGDGGSILSGLHYVNRFAHMITEVPWTEDIEVVLDEVEEEWEAEMEAEMEDEDE